MKSHLEQRKIEAMTFKTLRALLLLSMIPYFCKAALLDETNVFVEDIERSLSSRIVGGLNAKPTRYPYFAYLDIFTDNGEKYGCGGSLIAEDVVMSAGHCASELDSQVSSIKVWVNRTKLRSLTGFEYRRTAALFDIHPDYEYYSTSVLNDVMLIRLDKPVLGIPLLKINSDLSIPTTGQSLTVIGLGTTRYLGSQAENLMEVNIQAISYQDCNDYDSYFPFVNDEQMICAGVSTGGKDSCQGDSGGPLIIRASNSKDDVQVGIVSFGEDCGLPSKPGVYTRVSTYYDWINEWVCLQSKANPLTCSNKSESPVKSPSLTPTLGKSSIPPTIAPVRLNTPSERLTLKPVKNPTSKPIPTKSPTVISIPPIDNNCFSSESTVTLKEGGKTKMKDLQISDYVLVSLNPEMYEPVYAFGHVNNFTNVLYIQLFPSMIELTFNHLIFVKGKGAVPASSVQVGDVLVGGIEVTAIRNLTRRGMYNPFTPSGKIVVNGVLASNYISLQGTKDLIIGKTFTGISHHWLSHSFQLLHRFSCYHFNECPKETYTEYGISTISYGPWRIGRWLLTFNSPIVEFVLWAPLLLLLMLFAFLDFILTNSLRYPSMSYLTLFVGIMFFSRRSAKAKSQLK
jgi:Trypsin/Hint module